MKYFGWCVYFFLTPSSLTQPEYMQEARLIMAKLCYVEGDYRDALNQNGYVNLDDLQLVGAPMYRLSMIAEAYATKGERAAVFILFKHKQCSNMCIQPMVVFLLFY